MNEDEIEAILRTAGAEYRHMGRGVNAWCMDGDLMPMIEALLAAKPAPVAPMSPTNRLVAYAASQKLRELGYAWENETWVKT